MCSSVKNQSSTRQQARGKTEMWHCKSDRSGLSRVKASAAIFAFTPFWRFRNWRSTGCTVLRIEPSDG